MKQKPDANLSTDGLIRLAQLVPEIIPVSRATLWRMVAAGDFPRPIRLSKRIAAWRRIEVNQWLDSRKSGGQQ